MTHNSQILIATERERWLKLHLDSDLTIKDLRLKTRHNLGAKKIAMRLRRKHNIQIHWQTVHKILKRENLIKKKKRLPTKKKYVSKATFPGELVQIDVVYVRKYKGKWIFQFSAVDCTTRWKYSEIFDNQSNLESLAFVKKLIKIAPFTIKGIQTDNATIFTNRYVGYIKSANPMKPKLHPFDEICIKNGIVHYLIDPGKPAQNGKIERSNRTDREELWNHISFDSLGEVRKELAAWLKFYNEEREHLGIGGLTPSEKLNSCQI